MFFDNSGIKFVNYRTMQEFTLSRCDEFTSDPESSVYISFNEAPFEGEFLVACSGAALIIPDGKTKYWFLYKFLHTRDWRKVSKLIVRPKNYTFSKKELKEFGLMIVFLINNFISQNN